MKSMDTLDAVLAMFIVLAVLTAVFIIIDSHNETTKSKINIDTKYQYPLPTETVNLSKRFDIAKNLCENAYEENGSAYNQLWVHDLYIMDTQYNGCIGVLFLNTR